MKVDTKKMVISAVLVALSVVIILTFPKLNLGFFTATLASHVPLLIAIFISGYTMIAVVLATGVTFWMLLGPVVGLRAFSHIIFAALAYYLLTKGVNKYLTLAVAGIFHAVMECLVVGLFPIIAGGEVKTAYYIFVVTGVGTLVHHTIDCIIAVPAVEALRRARMVHPIGWNNKREKLA